MSVTLRGHSMSTCTRRVAVVLKEYDVSYELLSIDWAKAEHKTPEFLEHQPFGQVPYLIDGDIEVYESRAIAKFIALKYRGKNGVDLLPDPTDLKAVAKYETAASVEQSNFDPYASGLAAEKVFKPMRGVATNEDTVASYTATLDGKLDGYERILAKQQFLAGDKITIVDLFHLPYGSFLAKLGVNFLEEPEKRPNVARWWKAVSSRPSWQAVKDAA